MTRTDILSDTLLFFLFSARDWLSLSVDKAMIGEYSIASDYDGDVMKRQALDYMKEASVEGIVSELTDRVNQVKNLELDTRDITAERESMVSSFPLQFFCI